MLKTKALIIANLLASSNTAKEANKECNDIFRIIGGLLLPTELKVDTMNNMSKEDRKKLGDTLRAATAAAAKKATSSNKPKKSKQ